MGRTSESKGSIPEILDVSVSQQRKSVVPVVEKSVPAVQSQKNAMFTSGTSPTGVQLPLVLIIPRVLTVPNAARYLSATTWFVEELLRSGEVRSYIQGKRRVVDVRELDKYVDRKNAESPGKLEHRTANLIKVA